jgi:hypothetical protein
MPAKKQPTNRKKNTKASSKKRAEGLSATLRDYEERRRKLRDHLERELEQGLPSARHHVARMLRGASDELGRLEERGARAWKASAGAATRDTRRMLNQLGDKIESLDLARGKAKAGGGKKPLAKKKASKKAARKKAAKASAASKRPAKKRPARKKTRAA